MHRAWTRGAKICLIACACTLITAKASYATTFDIRPISFIDTPVYSMKVTGTISTGADPSQISSWDLTVTTMEQLAHYTRSNTAINLLDASVSGDGQSLTVATSPDQVTDGGALGFRSPNPFVDFGVTLADFTGANADGGQAMYMAGGNFDMLALNQPPNASYVAATLTGAPAHHLFALTPLVFSNDVFLTGTITTDGTSGPLSLSNILAWDIYVTQVTTDSFTPANSTVQSNLVQTSGDGQNITVDNPGGYLTFSKGFAGGHPYALQLADFTDDTSHGGRAGYYQGRLAVTTIDLGARKGPWRVTGQDPVAAAVPVPAGLPLLMSGLLILGAVARRTRAARR